MSLIKFRSPLLDLLEFNTLGSLKTTYLPATDIVENDNDYELALEVPGFNKSDFSVKIENNKLIISGEKKTSEKKYNLRETFQGSFVRTFNLPKNIKTDEINAIYNDGILTIKIPKDTTVIKTKLIEIL